MWCLWIELSSTTAMEISSRTVEGTCQQMCSRQEMIMRENEGLLHQLEMLTLGDDHLSTKSRCVKADPSRVVKADPSRVVKADPSRVVKADPSRVVKADPSRVVKADPSRVVKADPSRVVKADPSRVVKADPSRVVKADPSRVVKADPSRIVKQFSRPAAGRADTDPSDLRPASVLRETVTYLFESVVPRDHPAWSSIYEFVFDRLRAVRQDMVIQGIAGTDAVCLLEQIVRFHLYASYRLRGCDVAVFDPVINKQHLLECLKRLLYLYQVTPGCHRNQAEFESVYLLSNLGDTHALTHFLDLMPDIRRHPLIQQSSAISLAYVLRNYTRALKLISRLSCAMCLCAVNPHLSTLQINYLQILSAGYSVKNCRFPVSKLRQLLQLQSDEETLSLCCRCGLSDLFENISADSVCFNRGAFSYPKQSETPSALPELDRILRQTPVSSLLLGKTPGGMGVKDTERMPKSTGRGRGRGRRQTVEDV